MQNAKQYAAYLREMADRIDAAAKGRDSWKHVQDRDLEHDIRKHAAMTERVIRQVFDARRESSQGD